MYVSAIRVAGIAVGVTAFAVPCPASAQASPIAISSCTVLQAQAVRPRPFWYPWGPVVRDLPIVDGLDIQYSNTTAKVANRVAFAVNYRGDRQRGIDAGTFSPNAPINHMFGTFSGDAFVGAKPDYCRAIAVRFTDGTFWRAAGVQRATP